MCGFVSCRVKDDKYRINAYSLLSFFPVIRNNLSNSHGIDQLCANTRLVCESSYITTFVRRKRLMKCDRGMRTSGEINRGEFGMQTGGFVENCRGNVVTGE